MPHIVSHETLSGSGAKWLFPQGIFAMKIFQNKALWMRGAAVASVVWIRLLVIAAQLNRDFRWFGYEWQRGGDLGPATLLRWSAWC